MRKTSRFQPPGNWLGAIWHWFGCGGRRSGDPKFQVVLLEDGHRRSKLLDHVKAEMADIEIDGAGDIFRKVANRGHSRYPSFQASGEVAIVIAGRAGVRWGEPDREQNYRYKSICGHTGCRRELLLRENGRPETVSRYARPRLPRDPARWPGTTVDPRPGTVAGHYI